MSNPTTTEQQIRSTAEEAFAAFGHSSLLSRSYVNFLTGFAARLQRENTALACSVTTSEWESDSLAKEVLAFEMLGLLRVRRRFTSEKFPATTVMLEFCLSEEGRIYVERIRRAWGALGMKQATDDGKIVPMPWPGLPEPYQPGAIAPTF